MKQNLFETLIGAVVVIIAGFFLTYAYQTAGADKQDGYVVKANFPNTDGLKTGSDVMVNGVKVGSIIRQNLLTEPGPQQFLVEVAMRIEPKVKLPVDTVAMIASESLLGGKYLSLEIGVEDELVTQDGEGVLTHTQAPMRLDDLIGQLIFSNQEKDKKKSDTESDPPPPTDAPPLPSAPAQDEPGVVVP